LVRNLFSEASNNSRNLSPPSIPLYTHPLHYLGIGFFEKEIGYQLVKNGLFCIILTKINAKDAKDAKDAIKIEASLAPLAPLAL